MVTMRPGIAAIQDTLTPQAAAVVREAYADAKRRRHGSLAPLHVAAVLILNPAPGCPLRRACIESHKELVAHPLECRALELCFEIALDGKTGSVENPKNPIISNALVAALKRAQAQQRRGTPEQSLQPLLAVKVEMEQLMISLLDDPAVSRIFKEAKFDSTAVKIYMEDVAASQAASAAAGSQASLDATSHLLRRGRLPMSPFPASPLESGQFRQSSLFSSSAPFPLDSASDHGVGFLDRGKMVGSLLESPPLRESPCLPPLQPQKAGSQPPFPPVAQTLSFLENAAIQQKRMGPTLGRAMDNSGQVMRSVVDILLREGKPRNPVLVSDSGSSATSLTKEFAQWVKTGDVPPQLSKAEIVSLPINSLSIGLLSVEDTAEKLAQFRRTVEGYLTAGGAIIFLGDLMWLVETAQSGSVAPSSSPAHLVVRELEHLMGTHANEPLWFVSSASTQTFTRCQRNHPSLESQWGLQPIMATPNSAGAPLQAPRHGSYQLGCGTATGLKLPGMESGLKASQVCADCSRAYEEESARLMREERLAPASSSSGVQLNGLLTLNTQPVKEEKTSLAQKIQELWQKFHQRCLSHQPQHHQHQHVVQSGGSLNSISSPSVREASSSPVSEVTSLAAQEHPLNMTNVWVPHPQGAKSNVLPPHYATKKQDHPLNMMNMWIPQSVSTKSNELPLHHATKKQDHPLSMMNMWIPQPLGAKSNELPPHHATRKQDHPLNMTNMWVPQRVGAKSNELPPHSATKKSSVLQFPTSRALSNRDVFSGVTLDGFSSASTLDVSRKDGDNNSADCLSTKANMPNILSGSRTGCTAAVCSVRTDLALGRSFTSLNGDRDLGEQRLNVVQNAFNAGWPLPLASQASKGDLSQQDQQPLNGSQPPLNGGKQPLSAGFQHPRASKFEPWHETRSVASPLPSPARNPSIISASRPSDAESLKGLWKSLGSMVPWQKEAITAVASTVVKCRSGEVRRRGQHVKSDTWLLFLGPDRVGKREVARSLAKVVYGCEKKLIRMEFKGMCSMGLQQTISAAPMSSHRGKTPLDRLVDEVREKPFSVVLLEDIDRVDPLVRRSLIRAMERGKLPDSKGREVSVANAIVIMTCSAGENFLSQNKGSEVKNLIDFDEDKLLGFGPREVRMLINKSRSEKVVHRKGSRLCVVEEDLEKGPNSILLFGSPMFKRKAPTLEEDEQSSCSEKRCKREDTSPSSKGLSLDLNLSAEENVSEEEGPCCTTEKPESEEQMAAKVIQCARESLPKEIFSNFLDATVVFKPFNFHGLTDWVLEKLDRAFDDGNDAAPAPQVEVGIKLLEHMVSSAWQTFSDGDAFQGWVNNVLAKSMTGEKSSALVCPEAVVRFVLERDIAPQFALRVSAGRSTSGLLPTVIQVGP